MKKAQIMCALFALSACAAPMVNPNVTPEQAERDGMECEYEATKAVPDIGMGSAMAIGMQRGSLMRQCLRLRGYR